MTPTPKDIEAAEKLAKEMLDEYELSGFSGGETCLGSENYEVCVSKTGISRIAQALAAAREEGRLDMQTECLHVLATASNEAFLKHQTKTVEALNNAHEEIRNLPTNAPEGTETQTLATMKGNGQCGDCKFYRDDNGGGWPSGYGDCVRHPKSTRTNDGKSCGEYVFKDAPEGESDEE